MTANQNMLVIVSDEHQFDAMSCAIEGPRSWVKTPNLDKLAARGTRFMNAYTPSPICVPARASFATGQYAHQTRLWDNAMPYTGQIRGWGHGLQDKGVPVESIGKLHYRAQEDADGFDVKHNPMMVVNGVGMVWASIRSEEERVLPKSRMLGDYIGPGDSKYTDYDADSTRRCQDWFTARAASEDKRPWCLYVGLVAPHFPFVVPQEFYDMYPDAVLPDFKLSPRDGYVRHPWSEKHNALMDTEANFKSDAERKDAQRVYYGLCSWLDYNVGKILDALEASGMMDDTSIIYTSDHGDNVGARGLWGKSNMYQESAAIPMIAVGDGFEAGKQVITPTSLLDVSETILDHFDAPLDTERAGKSLYEIAAEPDDYERVVFSEYHAVGAVSGAFMLRQGRWKLIHYEGFEPELFDLQADPDEITNLAGSEAYSAVQAQLYNELYKICDPEEVNELAFFDQAALIESYGGREAALKLGAPGATPPPAS